MKIKTSEINIKSSKFNRCEIVEVYQSQDFSNTYKVSQNNNGSSVISILKVLTLPDDNLLDKIKQSESILKGKTIAEYFENIVNSIEKYIKTLIDLAEKNENVLKILDYDIIKNKEDSIWNIYIQLENLQPLKDKFDVKKLSCEKAVKIGIELCKSVELFHLAGIVHGNINDACIYTTESKKYKLGNFSFEQELYNLISDKTINSMPHLPPETFNGKYYNISTDIYSIGLFIYKLLNHGRMPFLPYHPQEITVEDIISANAQRMKDLPLPQAFNASNSVHNLLQKACAFNPGERYNSAIEICKELENIILEKKYIPETKKPVKIIDKPELTENKSQVLNDKLTSNSFVSTPDKTILYYLSNIVKKNTPSKSNTYKNSLPSDDNISLSGESTLMLDDDDISLSDNKSDENMSFLGKAVGNVIKEKSFSKVTQPKYRLKSCSSKISFLKSKKFLIPMSLLLLLIVFSLIMKIDTYNNAIGKVMQNQITMMYSDQAGSIKSINYKNNTAVKSGQTLLTMSVKNNELEQMEINIAKEKQNLTLYDKEIKSISSGQNLFDQNNTIEAESYKNFNKYLENVKSQLSNVIPQNETPKQTIDRLNKDLADANLYLNSLTAGKNIIEDSSNPYFKRYTDFESKITAITVPVDASNLKATEIQIISTEIQDKIKVLVELKDKLKDHDGYYMNIVKGRIEKSNTTLKDLEAKVADKSKYPPQTKDIKSNLDGIITDSRNLKVGDQINKDDQIYIITPEKAIMECTLNIDNQKNIKIGNNLEFTISGQTKKINGKIIDVKPANADQKTSNIDVKLEIEKNSLGIKNELSKMTEFKIKYLKGNNNLLSKLLFAN